jgi:NitT/TauT family transport system permease protein
MSTDQATGTASKRAYVVAIAFILFFWQVAAWFLPDFLMPDVHTSLLRLWEELNSAECYEGLANSMTRLGAG